MPNHFSGYTKYTLEQRNTALELLSKGYSHRQIAKTLNVPTGSISRLLSRQISSFGTTLSSLKEEREKASAEIPAKTTTEVQEEEPAEVPVAEPYYGLLLEEATDEQLFAEVVKRGYFIKDGELLHKVYKPININDVIHGKDNSHLW